VADEMLGGMIGSIHNLHFYLDLVTTARKKIEEGVFSTWKSEILPQISRRLSNTNVNYISFQKGSKKIY
jgi:queuine tRNA-ribosyltransferase